MCGVSQADNGLCAESDGLPGRPLVSLIWEAESEIPFSYGAHAQCERLVVTEANAGEGYLI